MKVVFSDLYKRDFSAFADEGLVLKAIEAPDRVKGYNVGGDRFLLSAKEIPAGKNGYFIIAFCSISEDKCTVLFAIRIYSDLHDAIAQKNPVEMLGIFLKKFGLNVKSKHKKQKLIVYETQRINKGEDPARSVVINYPFGKDFASAGILKVEEESTGSLVHILLYFAIDTDAYCKWLSSHRE